MTAGRELEIGIVTAIYEGGRFADILVGDRKDPSGLSCPWGRVPVSGDSAYVGQQRIVGFLGGRRAGHPISPSPARQASFGAGHEEIIVDPHHLKTFETRGFTDVSDPWFDSAQVSTTTDVFLGGVYDYEETGGTHEVAANATYWTSTYAGIDTSGGPRDGDPIYLFNYYGTLLAFMGRRVRRISSTTELWMLNPDTGSETMLKRWSPGAPFTVSMADGMATAINGFPTWVGASFWYKWQASGNLYMGFDHSTNDGEFLTPVNEDIWTDVSFSVDPTTGVANGTSTPRARCAGYENAITSHSWIATQAGTFSED